MNFMGKRENERGKNKYKTNKNKRRTKTENILNSGVGGERRGKKHKKKERESIDKEKTRKI